MNKKYRFGFIFLDEIHHINHFITLAISLSEEHAVTILTYPSDHPYLTQKLSSLGGTRVFVKKLNTHPFRRFTDVLKGRDAPRKGFWMKYNNRQLLQEYDALFFTDYIHHKLLRYRGDRKFPKFIKIPHGIAGRAYAYKNDLLDFDMHLIFGSDYYNKLAESHLLGRRTKIAGYFKSDAVESTSSPRLFENDHPIILYNPHFDPQFSSWQTHGRELLNYFKDHKTYNLIVAPHINLFNKLGVDGDTSFLDNYKNCPNIYIDTGSTSCVDMVYTRHAQLYIGDVSSQVMEFIIEPKPCIFINAHKVNYKNNHNYYFWKFGQVIQSIQELHIALQNAEQSFPNFKSIQVEAIELSFHIEPHTTATERGVEEVLKFMEESHL